MLFNLSDNDGGGDTVNNKNNKINNVDNGIKPSGILQISPDTISKRKINPKRRFLSQLSALKKINIIVPLIALVLMTVLFMVNRFANSADVSSNISDAKREKINTAEALSVSASTEALDIGGDIYKIYSGMDCHFISNITVCGSWTVADYVENIEDFDMDNRNYIINSMYTVEFFEDGTAVLRISPNEKTCKWINGNIFNNLSDTILVYMIKNINGSDYLFVSFKNIKNIKNFENLESFENFKNPNSGASEKLPEHGYYALRKNRVKTLEAYNNVKNKDVRNYDLLEIGKNMITISFNEKTKFPSDRNKMPKPDDLQPEYIMEHGKNPGLGIRALHAQGITGKGVSVAVIDESLNLNHPEYKGKIVKYKDFSGQAEQTDISSQGPAVASLLAGENTGTAPDVKIYYAAVPSWTAFDAAYYAKALDWIVETNKTLPESEKIRVVCISPNPEDPIPWINVNIYLKSFERAQKEGILVLDCSNEHGITIDACNSDFYNPEDVALCKPVGAYRIMISPEHYNTVKEIFNDFQGEVIRVPINFKTMAEANGGGEYSYQYDGKGGLSWAIPYATGVLAMGWQVKPELTADEMIKILFDTAYADKYNNKYIYPTAFIGYLQNN